MATMSVSGVASGMDWDSMIDEIITNAAKPAQVQVNKKNNLTNKKSLFEEMKVTMNSLQSSLSPLKLPSTYKAKQIDIERIDTSGSYKGVLTATVNADAEVNVYDLVVNQLARAQTNRSKQITAANIGSALSSQGLTSGTMYINMMGQKVGIDVDSSDSLQTLKSKINNIVKTLDIPIDVTASVVDNRLVLRSNNTGLGANTMTETLTYGLNGTNTITSYNVSDADLKAGNFVIRSGGTTYTYGKDYDLVNGNEIRWNQYEATDSVKLGDSVKATYKIAKGDTYESTGTYGTSEAKISGFSVSENETLSSRLRIVDENNNEYLYGKDFTLDSSGNVQWIEKEAAKTNEPSSYTVSYTSTETVSSTISGTKGAATTTSEPDSYIVKYTDKATGTETFSTSKTSNFQDPITLDFDSLKELYEKSHQGEELNLKPYWVSDRNVYYVEPDDLSALDITVNGTKYKYGRDFVITKNEAENAPDNSFNVTWGKNSGGGTASIAQTFAVAHGFATSSTYKTVAQAYPSSGSTIEFNMPYDYDYTLTGRVSASDNDKTLHTIFGSDIENFYSSKLTIRGYTNGTDYDVVTASDGETELKWIDKSIPSADDTIIETNFTALTEAYNKAYGTTEIPTVNLTDSNGVLRTYLDPSDSSLFTMTSGNTTYEYGKDYVIRVNDARNGYTISWAITNDANSDGSTDINDASTIVTTYTKYKDLSTYDMKEAPANGDTYSFTFSKDVTTTKKGDVKSTQTDKSLSNVLEGVTLRSSEYSSVVISDGTKTYTEGKDYVINSSGVITWLDQNSTDITAYKASYTFGTAQSTTLSDISASSSNTNLTAMPKLNAMGVKTFVGDKLNGSTAYNYIDEAEGKAAFTLTDSDGNTYEYGKDFALRSSSMTGTVQLVTPNNSYWPSDFSNQSGTRTLPASGLTLTYNNTAERIIDSSATLEEALGFIPSDWSKLTLTDADGNAYTEDTDYTIDTDTGAITWFSSSEGPNHPEEDISYTLIYDAFTDITASFTYNYNDEDTQEDTQEVALTVSSGEGNIGGTSLSYEQILSDTGLTSSSSASEIDTEFAKYFTLTDEDGVVYEYGKDYRIISKSDSESASDSDSDSDSDSETESDTETDSASSSKEHLPLIEWLSVPASRTEFTLSYSGRSYDTLELDVTRSNTDAVMAGTSGASPLYSYFDGGTSTITSGTKTFYEGIDYEITSYETTDDNGKTVKNAAVEWKTGTNSEWYYPGSNAGYTINLTTASGNSMSFSGVRSSQENINLSTYGFTSVNGSISSVSFTGDNGTYTYDLTSTDTDDDGNTSTQNMRDEIGLAVTNGSAGGGMFYFNWVTPARTANADLPSLGAEITAEYTYQANTFTLSDDSDGSLLSALELDQTDETHYTAAQNAELVLDGETITRDSNDIGEAYENELIKGMTIHLKGVGEVSLDVSHDAEKAVESIQTFVDTYNDLMTWMNTRMTEKQVDKDTAATIDSDDFRMRWGLLHGNSLLRNTKAKMRSLTSQNFTFSFTQRSSAEEIYGTMGYNGLRNDATLRLRINSKFVDVSILPTDTLQDIIDKINDDSEDGPMHDIYYDDEGKKLTQPLIKATIENDKLVITSTNNDSITMSGTSAMNALKMNYTYKGLFQLGIASTATDYGKSGELEFDTSKFMEALEDNADEVQELMLMFANDFDSWTKSMLNTSASGETSGTLTREIENLDNQINTINEYLEKYQERLDRQEESLRTRYASSETQFAKLSQQANSIAAILNQLNGYANNNNSSSSS